jgi:hypothetical protein
MNHEDPNLIRVRIGGASPATASPLARVLGAILGAAMFVAALVVGGVLLLVFLALAAALATAFAVRFWWWRRQLLKDARNRPVGPGPAPRQQDGRTTIDGDYRVMDD